MMARVRILEGPIGTGERVVLVSGKEEPEAEISAAMEAVLRIFKRINGILEPGTENMASAAQVPVVYTIRLLVVSSQAVNLIEKQGSSIKSIQEASSARICVITLDERFYYASEDERIVEIQGETQNVQNDLQLVVGQGSAFV
jgi:poly(rC)-binding protein 3/4